MQKLDHYEVIEAGSKIDSTVLNWLIQWAIKEGIHLVYEVDGKTHVIGGNFLIR